MRIVLAGITRIHGKSNIRTDEYTSYVLPETYFSKFKKDCKTILGRKSQINVMILVKWR